MRYLIVFQEIAQTARDVYRVLSKRRQLRRYRRKLDKVLLQIQRQKEEIRAGKK